VRLARLVVLFGFAILAGCESVDGRITILNETATPIVSVWIDRCDALAEGPDRLRGGRIEPGAAESFEVETGCHDVYVLTSANQTGYWRVQVGRGSRQVTVIARPHE
jgi:hypothetical protein